MRCPSLSPVRNLPPPPHPSPPHPSFSPPFSEKYYVLSRGKGGTGRENEGDEREPHPEAAVSLRKILTFVT